jgi:hypothetical protein
VPGESKCYYGSLFRRLERYTSCIAPLNGEAPVLEEQKNRCSGKIE